MSWINIPRKSWKNTKIKDDLRDELIQMAGYRNRMVHMYHMISDEELYDIITTELDDIKEFVSEIKKYIGSVHD